MIERLVSPQVTAVESFGDISDCKIRSQILCICGVMEALAHEIQVGQGGQDGWLA